MNDEFLFFIRADRLIEKQQFKLHHSNAKSPCGDSKPTEVGFALMCRDFNRLKLLFKHALEDYGGLTCLSNCKK